MSDLRELYQEVILDHNKRPRNFRAIDAPSRVAKGHNPLCGDRLTLYVSMVARWRHDRVSVGARRRWAVSRSRVGRRGTIAGRRRRRHLPVLVA